MTIICDKCKKELKDLGALVFSPPTKDDPIMVDNVVTKYHVCKHCWFYLEEFLNENED